MLPTGYSYHGIIVKTQDGRWVPAHCLDMIHKDHTGCSIGDPVLEDLVIKGELRYFNLAGEWYYAKKSEINRSLLPKGLLPEGYTLNENGFVISEQSGREIFSACQDPMCEAHPDMEFASPTLREQIKDGSIPEEFIDLHKYPKFGTVFMKTIKMTEVE